MATDSARDTSKAASDETKGGTQTKIKWDDSNMRSSYANVCNVASTREEMVLLFGINQSWNAAQRELTVQLSDRIILSPFAAKRLLTLLTGVVREYESRFGTLNIEPGRPGDSVAGAK